MQTVLNIDQMPASRRNEAWRDAICDTFVRLECTPAGSQPLRGRIQASTNGDLHVVRVISSPQIVGRTPRRIAQASDAYILMSLQLQGRTIIWQGKTEADLSPGAVGFYDTARPYTLALPGDFDQLVLHLPRELVASKVPGGLDRMAASLSAADPFALALSALAPQLLKLDTPLAGGRRNRIVGTAIDLVLLALESLVTDSGQSAPNHLVYCRSADRRADEALLGAGASALSRRACDLISRRLAEPDLSPALVAR